MAYCTEQDVIAVLIGRRDENRNETPADLDIDQIGQAIADADAQINLALKRRYVVPFVVVPDLVKSLSISISSYLSLLTFRGSSPVGAEDPMALRYDRARRMLDAIMNNRADLDGATEVTTDDGSDPAVFNEFQYPLFPLYPTFEEGYIPADKLYR
jgi:phage gp36-like protein